METASRCECGCLLACLFWLRTKQPHFALRAKGTWASDKRPFGNEGATSRGYVQNKWVTRCKNVLKLSLNRKKCENHLSFMGQKIDFLTSSDSRPFL